MTTAPSSGKDLPAFAEKVSTPVTSQACGALPRGRPGVAHRTPQENSQDEAEEGHRGEQSSLQIDDPAGNRQLIKIDRRRIRTDPVGHFLDLIDKLGTFVSR